MAVDEYDDHEIHINEHTRYLLSAVFTEDGREEVKARAVAHLRAHKDALRKEKSAGVGLQEKGSATDEVPTESAVKA